MLQPTPPAIADSARAQASPPSLMSCADESLPARTASRTLAQAAATASISGWGSPISSSPRSFASSVPARVGEKGPSSPIVSPSSAKALPQAWAGSGSSPTMATTGVG